MDLLSLLCMAVVEGGIEENVSSEERPAIRVRIRLQMVPQIPSPDFCLQQARNVNPGYTSSDNLKPAAWGAIIRIPDNRIIIIDPNSDFYGKVQPGDRVLTVNGMSYIYYYRMRKNFGQAGEVCNVVVQRRNGEINELAIRKKPIYMFGSAIQSAVLSHPG